MLSFKINLMLGYNLSQIKKGLEEIEGLHLGLFINSLRYDDEKESKQKKKEFYNGLSRAVKEVNKEIKSFNSIIKKYNKNLSCLKEIDLSILKKIVEKHKGDYPQGNFSDEEFGRGDSPSVLSRRHTSILIRNILSETRISIQNFLKSLEVYLSPFDKSINWKNLRKITEKEVDKIRSIYSINCPEESIFLIGRLLENIITEYIGLLKRKKLIDLKNKYIKSFDFKFENKIDFLHNSKNIGLSHK